MMIPERSQNRIAQKISQIVTNRIRSGSLVGNALIIAFPLIGVIFASQIAIDQTRSAKQRMNLVADATIRLVEHQIRDRLDKMLILRELVERNSINSDDQFSVAASLLSPEGVGFIAINRINADREIVLVTPYERNKSALGRKVGQTPEIASLLDKAQSGNVAQATGLVDLFQGGKGIATYFPIRGDNGPAGFVNGVISLEDITQVVTRALDPAMKITIRDAESAPNGIPVVPSGYISERRQTRVLNRSWDVDISLPGEQSNANFYLQQSSIFGAFLILSIGFVVSTNREKRTAQKERERLGDALDAVPVGIAVTDANEVLIHANTGFRNFFPGLVADGDRAQTITSLTEKQACINGLQGEEKKDWIEMVLRLTRTLPRDEYYEFPNGDRHRVIQRRTAEGGTIQIRVDVTAESRASKALERERGHLADAIESIPGPFTLFDREESLVVANEAAFARFASYGRPINLGITAGELVAIAAAANPDLATDEEKKDWVEWRMARFRAAEGITEYKDHNGRQTHFIERRTQEGGRISLMLDMTEARENEAALSEMRARFKALIDNAPFAICLRGLDGRIQVVNRLYRDWYFGPNRNPEGLAAEDYLPADRAARQRQVNEEILRTGKSFETERAFSGNYPGISEVRIWNFPVRDEGGALIGVAGFIADTTARKRAEREREIAQQELDAIINILNKGVITINEKGIIRTFSRPAERIFGYSETEVVGKNVSILMPSPYRDAHDQFVGAYIATGVPKVLGIGREVEGLRKDGTVFPADLAVCELPSVEGERRLAGMVRDETLRKEMERRLLQSERVESLGRLTGGIAHDFNNILGAISLNLEMIRDDVANNDDLAPLVGIAIRAIDRGRSLTKQLLAVAGRQSLNPTSVDVGALLSDTVELIRSSLGQNHQVDTNIEGDRFVRVDAGAFESAIVNLILNARDAMPEGGKITLETKPRTIDRENEWAGSTLKPGHYVEIAVSDTGTGMSPETLARAIEPFFTTKPVNRGTGLGLSMVQGFARQSQGAMHISSTLGVGTVVTLLLPAAEEADADGDPAARTSANEPKHRFAATVLLVEDDPHVMATLKHQLTRLGLSVIGAESGDQALVELGRAPDLDLVISDIRMPGNLNGIELARKIREMRPDLGVILMSGFVGDDADRRAVEELGLPFLKKPFGAQDLVKTLEGALPSGQAAQS